MKIQVTGDNAAANTLREHLSSLGYSLGSLASAFGVRLSEHEAPQVTVMGADGAFSQETIARLKELISDVAVATDFKPGTSPKELHISFPAHSTVSVELAVLRALLKLTDHGAAAPEPQGPATNKPSWIKKIFG